MTKEVFLTLLGNFICPLRVILVSRWIEKNHSSKSANGESGNTSSSKKED